MLVRTRGRWLTFGFALISGMALGAVMLPYVRAQSHWDEPAPKAAKLNSGETVCGTLTTELSGTVTTGMQLGSLVTIAPGQGFCLKVN